MSDDKVIPLQRRVKTDGDLPEETVQRELYRMRAVLHGAGLLTYDVKYGALILECGPSLEYDADGWHVCIPAGFGPLTGCFSHEPEDTAYAECLGTEDEVLQAVRAAAGMVEATVRSGIPSSKVLHDAAFLQRGYPDGVRKRSAIATDGMRTRLSVGDTAVASVEDFFRLAWGIYQPEEIVALKLSNAELTLRAVPGRWIILGSARFSPNCERYVFGSADSADADLFIRPGITRRAHDAFAAELCAAIAPLAPRLETLGKNIDIRRLERELEQTRTEVEGAATLTERRAAQRRERLAYRHLAEARDPSLKPSFEDLFNTNRLSIDGR